MQSQDNIKYSTKDKNIEKQVLRKDKYVHGGARFIWLLERNLKCFGCASSSLVLDSCWRCDSAEGNTGCLRRTGREWYSTLELP